MVSRRLTGGVLHWQQSRVKCFPCPAWPVSGAMCSLRCRSAQLLLVAALLPLAALAGCAANSRPMATASVPPPHPLALAPPAATPAPLANPLRALLVSDDGLSEDEAEAVVARATAAHEMSRP